MSVISGGGGGGGSLFTRSVSLLHDADIKTLHSVGSVLVEGVVGSVLVPAAASFTLDATAGAYTVDQGSLVIGTETDFVDLWVFTRIDLALTSSAGAWFGYLQPAATTPSTFDLLSQYEGQGLRVFKEGGSDPTDGNAANTLTMNVVYATLAV